MNIVQDIHRRLGEELDIILSLGPFPSGYVALSGNAQKILTWLDRVRKDFEAARATEPSARMLFRKLQTEIGQWEALAEKCYRLACAVTGRT